MNCIFRLILLLAQVLNLVQQNLKARDLIGPFQNPLEDRFDPAADAAKAAKNASKRDFSDTYLSPGTEPIDLESVAQNGVTGNGTAASSGSSSATTAKELTLGQKLAPLQEAAGKRVELNPKE